VALILAGTCSVAAGMPAQGQEDWRQVLDELAKGSPGSGDASWETGTVLDVNCADFASWTDAQAFYEQNGGVGNDSYGLDADGDGVGCESLG